MWSRATDAFFVGDGKRGKRCEVWCQDRISPSRAHWLGELEDLNQLCSDLKQQPFETPRKIIRRPASDTAETEIQDGA